MHLEPTIDEHGLCHGIARKPASTGRQIPFTPGAIHPTGRVAHLGLSGEHQPPITRMVAYAFRGRRQRIHRHAHIPEKVHAARIAVVPATPAFNALLLRRNNTSTGKARHARPEIIRGPLGQQGSRRAILG